MDRIALIGIEGLNNLSTRDDLEALPAFNKLINHAAKGNLENEIPLDWDLAWKLSLSGSIKAIESGKNLITELPKRGISTLFLSTEHPIEAPAEQVLAENVKSVLQGVPQKPVDQVDLLVLELTGYRAYLEKGGDENQYWNELDAALGKLLDSLAENTVIFTLAPVDTLVSNTGIRITDWLAKQKFYDAEDESATLVRFEEGVGLIGFTEKGLEARETILENLRNLKLFARRGGDLRVVEIESLPERMIAADQNESSVYISPKKTTIYLDFDSTALSAVEDKFQTNQSKTFFSTQGSIFVSGYKVDLEKELADISVLSIVPTLRDCFNLEPDWEMVRNSFKYQFSLRVIEEQASANDSGDESAVRSRLEALGY